MTQPTITVDREFRDLIPALTDEERKQLEDNIVRDKRAIVPLVVWEEGGVLLDGHNRFEICTRRKLPFEITTLSFDDRDAVKDWVITNQLGRRNLTKQQMDYLRGKKYELAKKMRGGDRKSDHVKSNPEKLGLKKHETTTAAIIGKQTGVSDYTVMANEKFSNAVDTFTSVSPSQQSSTTVKSALLQGKVKMSHAAAKAVPRLTGEQKADIVAQIESGTVKSVDAAINKVAPGMIKQSPKHIHVQQQPFPYPSALSPTSPSSPRIKPTVTPSLWRKVQKLSNELREMLSVPALQVSTYECKKKAEELAELVSSVSFPS